MDQKMMDQEKQVWIFFLDSDEMKSNIIIDLKYY